MKKIQFVKMHENAVVPKYQTAGAAGFDLHIVEDVTLKPKETKTLGIGLAMKIPEGYELQIVPRSGVSLKSRFRIANAPGCIDSDYTGEIKIIGHNDGMETLFFKAGDRLAQGKLVPVERAVFEEVDKLEETERGSGGFGSTGN